MNSYPCPGCGGKGFGKMVDRGDGTFRIICPSCKTHTKAGAKKEVTEIWVRRGKVDD